MGRFRLDRRIGRGGMGTVYRAYDGEREQWVALKTLARRDPSWLYRFKREFRQLADASHPNLVALYELVAADDLWFFTMELVEGVNFLRYVRDGAVDPLQTPTPSSGCESAATSPTESMDGEGRTEQTESLGFDDPTVDSPAGSTPGFGLGLASPQPHVPLAPPANLAKLRDTARQLALGLEKIHQMDLLHGDIKSSNVLVTEAGRVVVLDFGVMSGQHERHDPRTKGGGVPGTPAFMAPELFTPGSKPSTASDWYAFGHMLYEALAGRRPLGRFPSLQESIRARRAVDAPPPSAFRGGIPEDLDQLCCELLSRNPAQRPEGPDILGRLGVDARATATESLRARNTGESGVVVGRSALIETLHRLLAEVGAGAGRVAFLRGRSGIGKSTVALRFLAELRGAVVLEGRCYERESVPYKALDSAIDSLTTYLMQLDEAERNALLPSHFADLAQVFPVLKRLLPDAPAQAADTGHRDAGLRRRAFTALRALLHKLSERTPVVLYVDDLQWGDAESAPMFAELMSEPAPRLLLLGSYRSDEAASSPLLQALGADGEPWATFRALTHTMDVDPFDRTTARALVERLQPGMANSEQLIDRIADESEGSPYLIREFVQYLTTRDQVLPKDLTLESAILDRVSRLEAPAQALLQVVAVAGWRVPQVVARRAAGLETADLRTFSELRGERFVRTTGSGESARVEAYHDRVRESVLGTLDQDALRSLHLRLAEALEASSEAESPDVVYKLAAHYYHGQPEGRERMVFERNVAAGRMARDSYSHDQAYLHYQQAADVAERAGFPIDHDVQQELGEAASNTGRVEQAFGCFEQVLDSERDTIRRAWTRYSIARLHLGRMDSVAAYEETLRALAEINTSVPRSKLVDLLSAVWSWWRARHLDRDPRRFGRAQGRERMMHQTVFRLYQYATLCAYFSVEHERMAATSLRTCRPAMEIGLSPEYVEHHLTLCTMVSVLKWDSADGLAQKAAALAAELKDPLVQARTDLYLSFCARFRDQELRGEQLALQCLEEHSEWLDNVDFLTGVADISWSYLMRGHPAAGWHWVQRGLERTALGGADKQAAEGHSFRSYAGSLLTMLGRHDEGLRHLASFKALLREPSHDRWRWAQYLGHRAMALVLHGDLGDQLEEVFEQQRALGIPPRKTSLQTRHFYLAKAYARLQQLRQAPPSENRARRAKLRSALRLLKRVPAQITLDCHRHCIEAGAQLERGRYPQALKALATAEALAEQTENLWARAECQAERARLLRRQGEHGRSAELAQQAIDFAQRTGWTERAQAWRDELL